MNRHDPLWPVLAGSIAGSGGCVGYLFDPTCSAPGMQLVILSMLLLHVSMGAVALGGRLAVVPRLGTVCWLMHVLMSLCMAFGHFNVPEAAQRMAEKGLALPLTSFFCLVEQAHARSLWHPYFVILVASIHATLDHLTYRSLARPSVSCVGSWLAWQVAIALMPHVLYHLPFTSIISRLWPGGRRPAADAKASAASQSSEAPNRATAAAIAAATQAQHVYTPMFSRHKVSIRLYTNQSVDSLPEGTAEQVHAMVTSSGIRRKEPVHVLDVAIRPGSVLLVAELVQAGRTTSSSYQAASPDSHLSWVSCNVVPALMSHFTSDTGPCTGDVQLEGRTIRVHWDPRAPHTITAEEQQQQTAAADLHLVERVRLGLVWGTDPHTILSSPASTPGVMYASSLQVQICGIASCADVRQVVGSDPHVPYASPCSYTAAAAAATAGEAVSQAPLQLWAHCFSGYQRVRVAHVQRCSAVSSLLVQVEVELPSSALLRHQQDGLPMCLQPISLELWQGCSLLSSSSLLVGRGHALADLHCLDACWGMSPASAVALVQELHMRGQALWDAAQALEDHVDSEALQSHSAMMSDLATWVTCVWCEAVDSGSCLSGSSMRACMRLKCVCSLPAPAYQAIRAHLAEFCRHVGLHHTSVWLGTHRKLAWVQQACQGNMSRDASKAVKPSALLHTPSVLWCAVMASLRSSSRGFICPACEQAFNARLQTQLLKPRIVASVLRSLTVAIALLLEPRPVSQVTRVMNTMWVTCHLLLALFLVRGSSPPVSSAPHLLHTCFTHVLHMASWSLACAMSLTHVFTGVGNVSMAVQVQQSAVWVLLSTATSVSDFLPMRGMVSTWIATWLSVVAAVVSYVSCWGGWVWWCRAGVCSCSCMLTPLVADAYLRNKLTQQPGSGGSRDTHAHTSHHGPGDASPAASATSDTLSHHFKHE